MRSVSRVHWLLNSVPQHLTERAHFVLGTQSVVFLFHRLLLQSWVTGIFQSNMLPFLKAQVQKKEEREIGCVATSYYGK